MDTGSPFTAALLSTLHFMLSAVLPAGCFLAADLCSWANEYFTLEGVLGIKLMPQTPVCYCTK